MVFGGSRNEPKKTAYSLLSVRSTISVIVAAFVAGAVGRWIGWVEGEDRCNNVVLKRFKKIHIKLRGQRFASPHGCS